MRSRSRGLLPFLVFLLAGACCLAAQSKNPEDLAAGKILVAPRNSSDPIFSKSVILLVRYDKTGALGLMVNHRTTLAISRALPGVKGAARDSDPVFIGGPVELSGVFALARTPAKPEDETNIFGNIYFITTKTALEKTLDRNPNPSQLRIYLGYCGWAPHQLENEVLEGRWYIFDRSEAEAFDAKPSTLWLRLVSKTEQRFARLRSALPVR
ncbi:MAG TPA: YqgE/AlgH family protein [Candidatus Dormibacteraeota bacterium]|nr:YqgE/AlgH family protein [Candidatus Dormibacteraeota bacterium]